MKVWTGASAGTCASSEIIDLTGKPGGGAKEASVPGNRAHQEDIKPTLLSEDAVPAVGDGVVAADVVEWEVRGERVDAGSGSSSGKGKEPVQGAEAGPEAGGDGVASSAELVRLAAVVVARGTRAGSRRSRGERARVSGRRQTETMEGAAVGKSEHEGGGQGNVSTIGKGANAGCAEGQQTRTI